jgi:pimeloyl-ACP methyl ester carboxylesterase
MGRLLLAIAGLAGCLLGQCTKADASCAEKLPLGGVDRYSVVYRSFPLTQRNENIRRGLIVIHGAGRNADGYFASAMAGALIGDALRDTMVIAPRIASNSGGGCADVLDAGEISWTCSGAHDWRRGGKGKDVDVTTYDFVDEIVRKLADKQVFPNLRTVVVTGHSAGGQFTNRYAAANKIDGKVGVSLRYVVANPSSYLYLDDRRLASGACTPDGKCTGEFEAFAGVDKCAGFNNWHYGLKNRAGYAATVADEELRKNLIARDVVYLLGDLDTLPIGGFDDSCSAMAQGPSRFTRGLNYWSYMRSKQGAQHKLVVVPYCGHNGRCIYTADPSMPVIFPK